MIPAYALFHLNLSYSSIEEDQRPEVIEKCYWPLLKLIESHEVYFGLEMSGWTLEQIELLSPEWVVRFKELLKKEKCELIGSGYAQIVGPLVPYKVNLHNQQLGLEAYQSILNYVPKLVLVNEMAYSSGLVGVYLESGYQGIVMDRGNVSLAINHDTDVDTTMPCYARGPADESIPVLWSDSIMFQKLQYYAHGDIGLGDYLSYFRKKANLLDFPLALYANDAEIFDYRPGRYECESRLHNDGEWQRIHDLLDSLKEEDVRWLTPSQALNVSLKNMPHDAVQLTSLMQPIPVKKQAKYNISRWAVTGRNDLWLNTMCHRLYHTIEKSDDSDSWKRLCELWSSDLRTHITLKRWLEAKDKLVDLAKSLRVNLDYDAKQNTCVSSEFELMAVQNSGFDVEFDSEGILLEIKSKEIELVLNLRRGMAIKRLAFKSHDFVPTVGTLEHGYFQSIELGADFYSGSTVVDLIAEHKRITDLEWVTPKMKILESGLLLSCDVETRLGVINKEIRLVANKVFCKTSLPGWKRQFATIRLGTVTLLPEAFINPTSISIQNGGKSAEELFLDRSSFHSRPASTLVSASSGLGGESGRIELSDNNIGVKLSWDPAKCAALPMMHYEKSTPSFLARVIFSLCEVDETFEAGGELPAFELCIEPLM